MFDDIIKIVNECNALLEDALSELKYQLEAGEPIEGEAEAASELQKICNNMISIL